MAYSFDKMMINSMYGLGLTPDEINNKIDAVKKLLKIRRDWGVQKVIFNNPATVIFWADGTKTVVKTQNGEKYDPEKGFAMAVAKKYFGNMGNYYNVFKKWLPENISDDGSIKEITVAHINPIQNPGPVKDYFENGGKWTYSASRNGKYAKVDVIFTFDADGLATDGKTLIISSYDENELNESFNDYIHSHLSLYLCDVTVKEINVLAMRDTIYELE